MKNLMRLGLSNIASRLGYELRAFAPIDLRGKTDHPIAAAHLAGRRPCLIEVSLSECRGLYGFPFTSVHPFVRTAQAYTEGRISSYTGSPLEAYYCHFQPKHAGDLFSLEFPSSQLEQVPAFAFAWPWERISVQDRREKRLARSKAENQRRGARLSMEHGYLGYGPVSKHKGTIEFLALARLVDSIRRNGYVRADSFDGDIQAALLIDKSHNVRCFLRSGQHRAAVLAALGFDRIPVVINSLRPVRADEVDFWPHVKDGLFTRNQALLLFDRIFVGSPPPNAIPPVWFSGGN